MKDFFKVALLIVGMLVLVLSLRVAAFVHLHSDTTAVKDPAPIAATDGGCGVMAVKMPCFRHANPEGRAMASVSRQSGSVGAETNAAQDIRCAARQVKMPCFQNANLRS